MLNLKKSRSYRAFKKEMGQQNHLYITLLVGLSYLAKTDNPDCPAVLHTSWNPNDPAVSIRRSRQYASKSALNWCVDLLDVYMDNCNCDCMFPGDLKKDYDGADRSVDKKFHLLYRRYGQLCKDMPIYSALVALGIQWRNRMIHSAADNVLEEEFIKILNQNDEYVRQNFCNLGVAQMLNDFENTIAPSLKVATSIIHATHKFVESIDQALLSSLNLQDYVKFIFLKHMAEYEGWYAKITRQDALCKLRIIKQLLLNNGFTVDTKDGLTDEDLANLCEQVIIQNAKQ